MVAPQHPAGFLHHFHILKSRVELCLSSNPQVTQVPETSAVSSTGIQKDVRHREAVSSLVHGHIAVGTEAASRWKSATRKSLWWSWYFCPSTSYRSRKAQIYTSLSLHLSASACCCLYTCLCSCTSLLLDVSRSAWTHLSLDVSESTHLCLYTSLPLHMSLPLHVSCLYTSLPLRISASTCVCQYASISSTSSLVPREARQPFVSVHLAIWWLVFWAQLVLHVGAGINYTYMDNHCMIQVLRDFTNQGSLISPWAARCDEMLPVTAKYLLHLSLY